MSQDVLVKLPRLCYKWTNNQGPEFSLSRWLEYIKKLCLKTFPSHHLPFKSHHLPFKKALSSTILKNPKRFSKSHESRTLFWSDTPIGNELIIIHVKKVESQASTHIIISPRKWSERFILSVLCTVSIYIHYIVQYSKGLTFFRFTFGTQLYIQTIWT